MKRLGLCCYALTIGAGSALLASCGSQSPLGAPSAMAQASAYAARTSYSNYKVLYSFGAPPDGNAPAGSLIDVGGTLYGTTQGGGSYPCDYTRSSYYYSGACGTVFSITTDGTEKVLYNFGAPGDGGTPVAGLLDVGGTLYGTTELGGSYLCGYQSGRYHCGTVFSITPSGTEKVLHSFGGDYGDGVGPVAPLIDVKGTLYGTTAAGGGHSCGIYRGACGTVFSVTQDGTENVLHRFRRGRTHAKIPFAGLIDAGGTLYGTTHEGGEHRNGTVFSITPGGRLKVLHSFGRGNDGQLPGLGGLIEVKGTFYGTTSAGGANGVGTVFSITPDGKEKVLYSFSGPDGNPEGTLIDVKGTLYGTTGSGAHGYGTVFSITTAGAEKLLHHFGGTSSDGRVPRGGLIDVNGTLYGTTAAGGTLGYGTVFALTP